MSDPVFEIQGRPYYGLFAGRLSNDPNTGRVIIEVVDDDDEVLLKEGDRFVTFFAGMQLNRSTPTG